MGVALGRWPLSPQTVKSRGRAWGHVSHGHPGAAHVARVLGVAETPSGGAAGTQTPTHLEISKAGGGHEPLTCHPLWVLSEPWFSNASALHRDHQHFCSLVTLRTP